MKRISTLLFFFIICAAANASSLPEGKEVKVQLSAKSNGTLNVLSLTPDAVTIYLFDLDGRLIHEQVIKEKKGINISGLQKGCYMYSIMQKDMSIGEGKISVK